MVVLPFRRRGRRLSEPNYVNTLGTYYSDIGISEAGYVNTLGTYYSDSDIGVTEAGYVNANPYGLDILLTVFGELLVSHPVGFTVNYASSYDSTTKLDRYSVNMVSTLISIDQRIRFLTNAPWPLALNTDYWIYSVTRSSPGSVPTFCYFTVKDAKGNGNLIQPVTGRTSNIIRYAEAF